jgi:hypothetical protein
MPAGMVVKQNKGFTAAEAQPPRLPRQKESEVGPSPRPIKKGASPSNTETEGVGPPHVSSTARKQRDNDWHNGWAMSTTDGSALKERGTGFDPHPPRLKERTPQVLSVRPTPHCW